MIMIINAHADARMNRHKQRHTDSRKTERLPQLTDGEGI